MKIEPAKNNPCILPAAAVLIGSIVTGCEDQTAVGYVRPFFKDGEQQPASPEAAKTTETQLTEQKSTFGLTH